jgi:PAS domain S-box-containing protein
MEIIQMSKSNLDILKELTNQLVEKDTELKKSQLKYFEMFNSVAHPMILIDKETTQPLEVNEEAVDVYGYSKEEFMNITKGQIVVDFENFLDIIKNNKPYRIGYDKTKDGHKIPVEVYYSYYNLDGKDVVICSVIDISDKINIIRDLTLKNELYKGMIENTNELIVRSDMQQRMTFMNEAFCKLYGIKVEDYLGKSFISFVHPDDLPLTKANIEKLKQPPHRVRYSQREMTVKGWREIEWEVTLIYDYDKQPCELQAVGRDITDYLETRRELLAREEELHIKNEYFEKLLKLFCFPAFVTDLNHKILAYNSEAKRFINIENPTGEYSYKLMIHKEDREKFKEDIKQHYIDKEEDLKNNLFEGYYKMINSEIGHIKITSVRNLKKELVALIGTVSFGGI